MKPAVCEICGKSGSQVAGEWVAFSDYTPPAEGEIGHPNGVAWFCCEHLGGANTVLDHFSEPGADLLKIEYEARQNKGRRIEN